jgi:hypothetical protein
LDEGGRCVEGLWDVFTILTKAGWNLFSILTKGGIVMIPLLASSVISLAVTIERLLF